MFQSVLAYRVVGVCDCKPFSQKRYLYVAHVSILLYEPPVLAAPKPKSCVRIYETGIFSISHLLDIISQKNKV